MKVGDRALLRKDYFENRPACEVEVLAIYSPEDWPYATVRLPSGAWTSLSLDQLTPLPPLLLLAREAE